MRKVHPHIEEVSHTQDIWMDPTVPLAILSLHFDAPAWIDADQTSVMTCRYRRCEWFCDLYIATFKTTVLPVWVGAGKASVMIKNDM